MRLLPMSAENRATGGALLVDFSDWAEVLVDLKAGTTRCTCEECVEEVSS